MTGLRRFLTVCGWCLLVVLVPSSASWAATPAPAPSAGAFVASGWDCSDTLPPAAAGSGCVVTSWAPVIPVSAPVVVAPPALPQGGLVSLGDAQWSYLAFGLGLVVLLVSAHVVGGWRK